MKHKAIRATIYPLEKFHWSEYNEWVSYIRQALIEVRNKNKTEYSK